MGFVVDLIEPDLLACNGLRGSLLTARLARIALVIPLGGGKKIYIWGRKRAVNGEMSCVRTSSHCGITVKSAGETVGIMLLYGTAEIFYTVNVGI